MAHVKTLEIFSLPAHLRCVQALTLKEYHIIFAYALILMLQCTSSKTMIFFRIIIYSFETRRCVKHIDINVNVNDNVRGKINVTFDIDIDIRVRKQSCNPEHHIG